MKGKIQENLGGDTSSKELKFVATPEKGEVSALLVRPGDASHLIILGAVTVPMLFLSGTRDELADLDLLQSVAKRLGKRATLHCLDTADHGFRTLKRSRKSEEDVFVEMARILREWASRLI